MDSNAPDFTEGFRVPAIGEPGRAACEVAPGTPVDAGVADIVLSYSNTSHIDIRAASVRGLQHRAMGEPRQDAYGLGFANKDGVEEVIAIVCDGVGSLPQSHKAALLVTSRLVESGRAGVEWGEAFAAANEELLATAGEAERELEGSPLAMATTAVAVRARCDGTNWHGQTAWVGDSSFWHLSSDGEWTCLTQEEDDESGDEFYEPSSSALPRTEILISNTEFSLTSGALFLMTDGVGNPLSWTPDVQTALATWWAAPPEICAFGSQVGFARRAHIDDRTVIGMWIRP
jgi:serine/threonine protein phosphatase PrpC